MHRLHSRTSFFLCLQSPPQNDSKMTFMFENNNSGMIGFVSLLGGCLMLGIGFVRLLGG